MIGAVIRFFPAKVWAAIGVVALVVALFGAYKFQEARANRAVAEARTATVTADALDKVATETTDIRQDQQEKSRAVEEIEGSDTRLPDGYGRELERVRRGNSDSR